MKVQRIQMSDQLVTRLKELRYLQEVITGLVAEETAHLNKLYVGKLAKVSGKKGWNKGIIWAVNVSYGEYSSYITTSFTIGPTKKSATTVYDNDFSKIEILSDEALEEFKKTMEMHERINSRGNNEKP